MLNTKIIYFNYNIMGGVFMRNYEIETKNRVEWIKKVLYESGTKGIIFGNSGGKDSALVGILCKKATDSLLGVIMPCGSSQNYKTDKQHALLLAQKFNIKTAEVDLTQTREVLLSQLNNAQPIAENAKNNINPRLRMTTLYAIGQSLSYLVAGTGNKSEAFMGYFTKFGDGGCDFNPIADLSVSEVFEFLRFLEAPEEIINKAPSAGLFEGQTDEGEMGVTYAAVEKYMEDRSGNLEDVEKIEKAHALTMHKRKMPLAYGG